MIVRRLQTDIPRGVLWTGIEPDAIFIVQPSDLPRQVAMHRQGETLTILDQGAQQMPKVATADPVFVVSCAKCMESFIETPVVAGGPDMPYLTGHGWDTSKGLEHAACPKHGKG